MYFNKLHVSFVLGTVFLTQPAIAEKHHASAEKPKAEKKAVWKVLQVQMR